MKKIIKNSNIITFILIFVSFMLWPIYISIFSNNVVDTTNNILSNFSNKIIWLWFSLSWVSLFTFILYLIKPKVRYILYYIIQVGLGVLFCSHICYEIHLGKFLIFSDLFSAGEGLQYASSVLVNLDIGMVIITLINIGIICAIHMINKNNKQIDYIKNKSIIICFIISIILFRIVGYISLGNKETNDMSKEYYNPKNIYENYNNPNTAMYVSGLYEYSVRSVYKYIYNISTINKTNLKKIINRYNKIYGLTTTENDYTGIFEGKNVIFIMMESIDSWIIDKNTMPTLTKLQKSGLNFTNRYSPFFNGGQTINSEFALNTGLYAISDNIPVYDIENISYPYSFANMLKKNGYKVNSLHSNTGEFYNRTNFHALLGYNNHYALEDMQKDGLLNQDTNYFSDSALISDDDVFDLIVNYEAPFATFITTYSAHLEYTKYNKVYKTLNSNFDCSKYNEEECIYRTLANDTDNFIKILINKLKKNKLLDNTVLVFATDHYVYGYSDSNYVASKKNVLNDRKLLQNTPLIIWSSDIEAKNIDTILDTADVLPTLLNMLNIDYDPNKYMGTDVFSKEHDQFVWFSDGLYIASKDCNLSEDAILTKSSYNINKNKSILLTNYYG